MSKAYESYHRIYFLLRGDDHYRVCGFGVPNDISAIFEFYFNHINFLRQFIAYFECEAYHLINQAKKKSIVLPEHQYLRADNDEYRNTVENLPKEKTGTNSKTELSQLFTTEGILSLFIN